MKIILDLDDRLVAVLQNITPGDWQISKNVRGSISNDEGVLICSMWEGNPNIDENIEAILAISQLARIVGDYDNMGKNKYNNFMLKQILEVLYDLDDDRDAVYDIVDCLEDLLDKYKKIGLHHRL